MNITQLNATLDALSQATQRAEAAEARATTAERERDEASAELERVKAERDAAREFLAKIISMEENNGVLNGVWINLENARKAAGLVQP